jgi:hypothetical protein
MHRRFRRESIPELDPDPVAFYGSHHIASLAEQAGIPGAFELHLPAFCDLESTPNIQLESDPFHGYIKQIHLGIAVIGE